MPANKERLTISVDATVKDNLDRQVPKSQRSAFAEKALEAALDRLAREKAIQALDAVHQARNPRHVPTEDVLRKLRAGQGEHLK